MQEVKPSSERQEVLTGLVENKIRSQSKATEEDCETIFEGRDKVTGRIVTRKAKEHFDKISQ